MYVAVLRYGDESSADDKDDEVKEPDHRDESLQSLVENTRFFIISQLRVRVIFSFGRKMFLLEYSLEVKIEERKRLDRTLKVKGRGH